MARSEWLTVSLSMVLKPSIDRKERELRVCRRVPEEDKAEEGTFQGRVEDVTSQQRVHIKCVYLLEETSIETRKGPSKRK